MALLVAVAFLLALRELPKSVRAAHARIAENAELSPLERELAPTRAFGLNPSLILRADEVLPPDAVFHVVMGPGSVSGQGAAAPFSAYWLLPRRHTSDPHRADWILSFGGDMAHLGVKFDVVADLGEGMQLLRVRR